MTTHHRFPALHSWRLDTRQARQIQVALRGRVLQDDDIGKINCIAGVDVGFEHNNSIARAAVVVLAYPNLEVVENAVARRKVAMPYIPGYLSFREVPSILAALSRLRRLPNLILCDGQGYAHPRRFGLACHLGVITDLPTIGVAKTRLTGIHEPPGNEKGDWTPLQDQGEVIGAVLRTRRNTRPVYVSLGHRVSLATTVTITLACCTRYRLPETTRAAHKLASAG